MTHPPTPTIESLLQAAEEWYGIKAGSSTSARRGDRYRLARGVAFMAALSSGYSAGSVAMATNRSTRGVTEAIGWVASQDGIPEIVDRVRERASGEPWSVNPPPSPADVAKAASRLALRMGHEPGRLAHRALVSGALLVGLHLELEEVAESMGVSVTHAHRTTTTFRETASDEFADEWASQAVLAAHGVDIDDATVHALSESWDASVRQPQD